MRHFRDRDPKNGPEVSLGKRFSSPIKKSLPRSKRAKQRQDHRDYQEACCSLSLAPEHSSAKSHQSHTPSPLASSAPSTSMPSHTVAAGEQLEVNYQVHELPVELAEDLDPCPQEPEQDIVVNTDLLAQIKVLESENKVFRGQENESIQH